MHTRRIATASIVLLLLAGCGGGGDDPESAAPEGSETPDDRPAGDQPDDEVSPSGDDDAAASGDDWDADLAELPSARVTVDGDGQHELLVRVAAEPDDRTQGLMGVEHLPDEAGMLFAFPDDHDGGFWMKNTLIPLDIAFTDEQGTIVAIEQMVPCEEDPCPTYEPGTEYRLALEVPAGWLEERGVQVGDALAWDDMPEAG